MLDWSFRVRKRLAVFRVPENFRIISKYGHIIIQSYNIYCLYLFWFKKTICTLLFRCVLFLEAWLRHSFWSVLCLLLDCRLL